jgi:hypothetical protein
MNSYFLMYEFISGGAMYEVPPSLWRRGPKHALTHFPFLGQGYKCVLSLGELRHAFQGKSWCDPRRPTIGEAF